MRSNGVGKIDFPTLGDLLDAWIEQHCYVPGGVLRGKPFRQYDWQFWCTANHYRVREGLRWEGQPILNQAFVYRRSQVVAPQKMGKGPWVACLAAAEAVGPTQWAGWAKLGEAYSCEANGCDCGWSYEYEPGEPKGMRHPSPLIQLLATSAEQAETNMYGALKAMATKRPLSRLLLVREGFIRIVGQSDDDDLDRIDVVTASAQSRIGNPISKAFQDESGLYTKSNKMRAVAEAQRRGAAGMGGRTIETTNPWDPAEESVAQTTWESSARDVFRFWRNPDLAPSLIDPVSGKPISYSNKENRRRIHAYVYEGADHVNLDSIEGEAAELAEKDPTQAERFFGNRVRAGGGSWLPDGVWDARHRDTVGRLAA